MSAKRSREPFVISEHVKRYKKFNYGAFESTYYIFHWHTDRIQSELLQFICNNAGDVDLIAQSFREIRYVKDFDMLAIYKLIDRSHGVDPLVSIINSIQIVFDGDTEHFVNASISNSWNGYHHTSRTKDSVYEALLEPVAWGEEYHKLFLLVCALTIGVESHWVEPVEAAYEILEKTAPEELIIKITEQFTSDPRLQFYSNVDYRGFESVHSYVIKYKGYHWGIRYLDHLYRTETIQIEYVSACIGSIFKYVHDDTPSRLKEREAYLIEILHHPFFNREPQAFQGLMRHASEWSIIVIMQHFNIFSLSNVHDVIDFAWDYWGFEVFEIVQRESILLQFALFEESEWTLKNVNDTPNPTKKEFKGQTFFIPKWDARSVIADIKARKQQYLETGMGKDVIGISLSYEFMMYNQTLQQELYSKLARM